MKRLTKILIGVGIGVLLIAVLVLTLVIVLRKEEWIVLEKSFSSLDDQCTTDWGGSSDWKRTRCKMPLICAAAKDQSSGYCRLPMSEGEGKSCAASVHLCAAGLTCDPYLKICRRLISIGGSCTEQNAFLCESGICGYAGTQTLAGEPLFGRHSLSRYCLMKDLPPGAACDRFRHCVTDCLQCVHGVCKPVFLPLDQHNMLLEHQKEIMLPLSMNGFSADETQPDRQLQTQQQQQGQQQGAFSGFPRHQKHKQHHQQQQRQQPTPAGAREVLDEEAVRAAWQQRAAEVSALLGEPLTALDLAAFFSVPRDADGQPLDSQPGERQKGEEEEEALAGQQANWKRQQHQIQALQQRGPLGGSGGFQTYQTRPQPVLNGSLAKRLARLFAGVSYAFTPEDQQASLAAAFGSPAFGFPSAMPPAIPPSVGTAALGGMGGAPQQSPYASAAAAGPLTAQSLQVQQQEQLAAQLQRLQLQQQLQQQGYSPYDSALEAMEVGAGGSDLAKELASAATGGEDENTELEGHLFPGIVGRPPGSLPLLGLPSQNPLIAPLGVPPFTLQSPRLPPRLPPLAEAPLGPLPPPPVPPLSNVPLGGVNPFGGPMGTPPLPNPPISPQPPLQSKPPFVMPPDRLPPPFKIGCWVDRCCAFHHYCSSLHATQGCQMRKSEGAACVGDSARECEDELSCVNGQCSPWFNSRPASSGDLVILTEHVDLHSVCAPWQQFEYGHSTHATHMHDGLPPQMPLEPPNPLVNSLPKDLAKTMRKITGRCITLDKRPCVTDRECWGLGGFGFCDVRSKKCRTPAYPACLSLLKELYACLWHGGRLRESTEDYIVTQVPRTPQFLLHECPVSVNHVQSKCMPSFVIRKRAELLKCVQSQGFTLERIVELPSDWDKI